MFIVFIPKMPKELEDNWKKLNAAFSTLENFESMEFVDGDLGIIFKK